jgi:hypothetical protein
LKNVVVNKIEFEMWTQENIQSLIASVCMGYDKAQEVQRSVIPVVARRFIEISCRLSTIVRNTDTKKKEY